MTNSASNMNNQGSIPRAPENTRVFIGIGIAIISIAFGGLGTWAAVAPLDSAAIAPGIIAVESNRKTVQHLEGGIVKEILVRDGDRVREGDVLLRLDDTKARAVLEILRGELDAALAQKSRLVAERDGLAEIRFPEALLQRAETSKVREAIAGQSQLFDARRKSLQGQLAILDQRISQFNEEMAGLEAQQAARRDQLKYLQEELGGLRGLEKAGHVARTRIFAYEREIAKLRGERGEYISEIARAQQGIGEAELQIIQRQQSFREEVVAELRELEKRIFQLEERLVTAQDELDRTDVRAPVDGIVMDLDVHTAGGVVRPGEDVMEVVPMGDRLIIEARISPQDIDDVAVEQEATVRFTGMRFRSTPVVIGRVINVSADRLLDEYSGVSYYLARIEIPKWQEKVLVDLDVKLHPGMPADVLIKTGTRTVLRYVMGPVGDGLARAFKEK
ncbi:MAG: HlyD family type I secretion periplasmic adaptor subunit [Gammaproteobacteria bacterium]|nr:HlyD family type I secretion periplasmic adaptor subunit [Gammaproteobacteria bacterium]